jgi:hypothetical protein
MSRGGAEQVVMRKDGRHADRSMFCELFYAKAVAGQLLH